ncbi:hypothetical protein D3C71_2048360 [compost metagenome]
MAQNLVQVAVIEFVIDIALQRCQFVIVAHEPVLVQVGAGEFDHDDVVMAVQAGALMIRRQMRQLVRGGEMEFLGDAIHQRTSSALKPSVAAFQKSGSS